MKFTYTGTNLKDLERAENYRFIQGNGLGGYLAMTAAFSVNRCDDGLLCASIQAPNIRRLLVHRLREELKTTKDSVCLSAQRFMDEPEENGLSYLQSFVQDALPVWTYQALGIDIRRTCAICYHHNTSVVIYEIVNTTEHEAVFKVEPIFLMEYRGDAAKEKHGAYECSIWEEKGERRAKVSLTASGESVGIRTNGKIEAIPQKEECLAYPEDEKDGRPAQGYGSRVLEISWTIPAGGHVCAQMLFLAEGEERYEEGILSLLDSEKARREALLDDGGFRTEEARELARAADLYLSRKEATNGSTLLAGYPLFGDWGRDTMISLAGCILAVKKYDQAKEIFQTFLKYEKNGLVPNLFPEKGQEPMYNSVDAPLLLIEGLHEYVEATGDFSIVEQNWDTLERIIHAYRTGTDYNIRMDEDFLISEGKYPWQLTWMDACINGILPTPRYGKPVEINAFWYNALMIMADFAKQKGEEERMNEYHFLAEKVKASFIEKFWIPEKGYLRDLVSGDDRTDLQIRCNQIWALSLTYRMLSEKQEQAVLKVVTDHLYTSHGLRTLSPEDPEYHGYYGGPQFDRDMAYHQGTIWVYPMGAYYRAILKAGGGKPEAADKVRRGLAAIKDMLREGCAGQLPEIYDGDRPYRSKGCYAQCWSVGEILRVYSELEKIGDL